MKRLFVTLLCALVIPTLGMWHANAVEECARTAQDKTEAKSYDVYVGKYEVKDGFILTVTNENNKLMAQPTGDAKIEFAPEAEADKFSSSQENVQLKFVRDQAGAVIGVIVTFDGHDFQAKKIK